MSLKEIHIENLSDDEKRILVMDANMYCWETRINAAREEGRSSTGCGMILAESIMRDYQAAIRVFPELIQKRLELEDTMRANAQMLEEIKRLTAKIEELETH